jgi:hypothetical protein
MIEYETMCGQNFELIPKESRRSAIVHVFEEINNKIADKNNKVTFMPNDAKCLLVYHAVDTIAPRPFLSSMDATCRSRSTLLVHLALL